MCGLLGFLSAHSSADQYSAELLKAMESMHHRGPDEPGTWACADVALGFNRLSIIDIEHSHQPLIWGPQDNPERYALTFNGEIYNYLEIREQLRVEYDATFITEGDGESIVAAIHYLGIEEGIKSLRGMFGFALWDSHEGTLTLGRDYFGIKPMFYAQGPDGLAFGSEKKSVLDLLAITGCDDSLDPRALQHYVALQYVPEPETLHTNVRRVESGSYCTIAPGGEVVQKRYFYPSFPVKPVNSDNEAQCFAAIADALEDSVAKHMRADVTVGSFLSGGIDSTAIAALAKRHNPDLLTFTTGFERDGYSEIDVAAESAAAIDAEHIVKVVSPEEFAQAVPEIVWYLDEPVADPALIPLYFVAQEARKHVKVVLSGEGADELFGGYTIYKEPLSLQAFEKVPGRLRRSLGSMATKLPEGMKGKSLLQRGSISLEERYYGNARSFNREQLEASLAHYNSQWGHEDVTASIYQQSQGWDPVARMQHVDLFTWLRGDILVKADKMTMANSLELRVPFLDKEVFDVASTLPYDYKISHGTTKYALRKSLENIVPSHVLHRKKLGFPVPTRHWLAGDELHGWAQDTINQSQAGHLVDLDFARTMLAEHRRGGSDHSRRLWTILIFLIWHGIFVEDRIHPNIEHPTYPVKL